MPADGRHPLEVVDVVVEQGYLDDRPRADPALEARDVLAVAVGERLVVDEAARAAVGSGTPASRSARLAFARRRVRAAGAPPT